MAYSVETHANAREPKRGEPFRILEMPFLKAENIVDAAIVDGKVIVDEDILGDEQVLYDWPAVYILDNGKKAYVGQTTNFTRRMGDHGRNDEKRGFTRANLITHPEFNQSVIIDYEHKLISLMAADGKYELTNKNNGWDECDFFSRNIYDEMFEDLWEELRGIKLVDKTIAELENSEVFKYSPYKELNLDQKVALEKILSSVLDAQKTNRTHCEPVVVDGKPGTGKTILALFLLKMLKDRAADKDDELFGKRIFLVEPISSIRKTVKEAVGVIPGIRKKDIIGPYDLVKLEYGLTTDGHPGIDICIIDESHRLKRFKNLGQQNANYMKKCALLGMEAATTTQLDWVLKTCKLPIFLYDSRQSVLPADVEPHTFRERLGDVFEHPITLDKQMRVKGGNRYLDYVEDILKEKDPVLQELPEYELCLHNSFASFNESFVEHLEQAELTRMVAGYGWEWNSKDDASRTKTDIHIDGIDKRWNSMTENWVGEGQVDEFYANEVGCIHSVQGYDLSYAYVIFGPEIRYDEERQKIIIDQVQYFDKNGKRGSTPEDVDAFIRNIYYVLLTRGIEGTHVYVCDPALREYLSRYMDVVE